MAKRAQHPDNGAASCAMCGAAFPVHPPGYCGGTGYAIKPDGARICYPCASAEARAAMVRDGRAVMYLTIDEARAPRDSAGRLDPSGYNPAHWCLTGPGTLRFALAECWPYRHPFSGSRRGGIAFRFRGPDGAIWHGRHDSATHDIVTVRRCKARAFRALPEAPPQDVARIMRELFEGLRGNRLGWRSACREDGLRRAAVELRREHR